MDSLIESILSSLSENGAENIEALELEKDSEIAKVMILASLPEKEENKMMMEAILQTVGDKCLNVEGEFPGEWIIIDCNEVVVELFTLGARNKYNLDKLWSGHSKKIPVENFIKKRA